MNLKRSVVIGCLFFTFSLFAQNRLMLESHLPLESASWDIFGYFDSITQKEYAIIGSNGITIVDITDSKKPFIVSNISGVAEFDHKVWKHYVYTVTGNGVNGSFGHIIDISDVYNPVLLDSFPSAHNLFIDKDGFMYASNPGVVIYDLNNNPAQPDSLTKVGVEGHDVTVIDSIMYDFHGRYGTNIWDVKDRKNPILLSYIADPLIEYHHQGWVSKDGKYLYICDELAKGSSADITVWDITNLDDPERVGEWGDNSATVHNLYVINDWIFTSYYAAGIRVFDTENPTKLILTDEYDTTPDFDEEGFEGVFGIYPFAENGKILASDRKKGLYVFSFDSTRVGNEKIETQFNIRFNSVFSDDLFSLKMMKGTSNLNDNVFYFSVYNVLGQLVLKDKIILNDIFQKDYFMPNLRKGAYFVYISNTQYTERKKIVKF